MDFEVKHLICAGLDVHKKTIVAAVCMTDPVTLEAAYKMKSFSTNNSQIAAMRDWLLSYNCHDVCMESTGKYYIPVYNVLESHISNIVVANPKWVRAVKGENIGDARHGARYREAQHGGELDGLFALKLLAHHDPGDQQAEGGGDRRGDPGVEQGVE